MKLFSIIHEGESKSDYLVTLELPKKSKQVLNKKKSLFYFVLSLNTKPLAITSNGTNICVRRSLRFAAPFKIKYKKSVHLEDYAFMQQSNSDLEGFLKLKDIQGSGASIVNLSEYAPKVFAVRS